MKNGKDFLGCSNPVQHSLPEKDPLKPYVHRMLASSERATFLTRGLLAFTKEQIANPCAVGLNQIVIRVRQLISQIVGDRIELRTHLSKEDPVVWVDVVQIEQVFMNLATNARDAMPEGGVFTIRTGLLNVQDRSVVPMGAKHPWKCAVLSFRDTGVGITEEAQKKRFDPFFTTRGYGKGMGSGLSIVLGIIKQHRGSINVTTEQGKGTILTLYLPLVASSAIMELSHALPARVRQNG